MRADWTHSLRTRLGVGACKHGNESLGSIKGKEFTYQLSDYHILNRYFMELVISLNQFLHIIRQPFNYRQALRMLNHFISEHGVILLPVLKPIGMSGVGVIN